VSEAFGGIKEVKLGGLEQPTLSRFDAAAKRFAGTQLTAQVVALLPRFALEIIAFGGILGLVLFLMHRSAGLQAVLPIIALYALAGYRLLPALQMAYDQATKLRFSGAGLDRLHKDLTTHRIEPVKDASTGTVFPQRQISLAGVTFSYPNAERHALEDIYLEIPARSTVGLVGKTGSGKTTAVDIMLGLLRPQSGTMTVDDVVVTPQNCRAWQKSLGYVPQQIFLADESVAANIAFGVPDKAIDRNAVERAAKIANLHQFIVDELPAGYETIVGERGIRLSGGQRQRIGIARALYHEPRVLILDEATSALDNLTEQAVMDAVHNLSGEITIILIAHRLSTVRECDRIFVLELGRLVGSGTFDELKAGNERFRAMAGV